MKLFILVSAFVLAVLRVYIGYAVEPEAITYVDVYKDLAHVFMGGLLVSYLYSREKWQLILFIGMNVLEVVVAVWSRVV